MDIRAFRCWVWILLGVATLASNAGMGYAQEGRVSRATLRELRKGIDLLEEAEEEMLLAGEGLALVFERFEMTQARVGELLAGKPPGVKELIEVLHSAGTYECADLTAARQAHKIAQETYGKAAEIFDRIASANPELADAHLLAGMARLGLSDAQKALAAFRQAKALGAQKVQGLHLRDPEAVFGQPMDAWRLGEVARAVSVAAQMVPLDTRVPPLYGYGLAYGEAGVWFGFREGELNVPKDPPEEEEEDLFAAIEIEGEGAGGDDLFSGISETPAAKVPLRAPAAAPEKPQQPAETAPVTPKPTSPAAPAPATPTPAMTGLSGQIGQLTSLATAYAKRGECEKAQMVLDALEEESALGPLDAFSRAALAGAHFNLGSAYLKQRRLVDALAAYRKARQFAPKDAKTYYSMGVIYRVQKDYTRAAEALEQAVRLNPNLASAYFNLGSVYRKMERMADARRAFQETLRCDPNHASAQYMLGLMAWTEGKWQAAASAWQKVLEIDPDHKNAKEWLPKAERRVAG